MWWWEVEYPQADGTTIKSANEIHVPVAQPVEIHLTTRNVIHSFWVPTLHGKMDLIPGRTNRITIQMDETGVVRCQCAEFCGLQHTLMSFWVVAHPPDEFDAWMEAQRRPAVEPGIPELARGRDAFQASGCGSCHRICGLEEGAAKAGGDIWSGPHPYRIAPVLGGRDATERCWSSCRLDRRVAADKAGQPDALVPSSGR
jgi:cytochrome c oxidase subunit 2